MGKQGDKEEKKQTGEVEIRKDEFLNMSTGEIRRIVTRKKKPKVGVFIADGNRRLTMIETGLIPNTTEFYEKYAQIFLKNLRNALDIFFDHGLKTIFFPLLGPSLLLRKNKFQTVTIPFVYKSLFLNEDWHRYFKEKDIKIKAYGQLDRLNEIDTTGLNMLKGINDTAAKTGHHKAHTLFIGFLTINTIDSKIAQQIIEFHKTHKRVPDLAEMIKAYYGEFVDPVDFFISSNKLAGIHAFPPLLNSRRIRMYYFTAPFFLAFTAHTFRKILYDLLFLQPDGSISEYDRNDLEHIDTLAEFYQKRKDKIIGTGKRVGRPWVLDI